MIFHNFFTVLIFTACTSSNNTTQEILNMLYIKASLLEKDKIIFE